MNTTEVRQAVKKISEYCKHHFPDCSECMFAIWTEDSGYCMFSEETLPANWTEDGE
jgi:hypothetical protein